MTKRLSQGKYLTLRDHSLLPSHRPVPPPANPEPAPRARRLPNWRSVTVELSDIYDYKCFLADSQEVYAPRIAGGTRVEFRLLEYAIVRNRG